MFSSRFRRFACLALILCFTGFLIHCSDPEAPDLPTKIRIVSGNNQFSRFGTELPEPFVVQVTTESGALAAGISVAFQPTEGGGSFSKSTVLTNDDGVSSSTLTLGPAEGSNSAIVTVEGNSSLSVRFNATAGYTYCAEAETTLSVFFGTQGHLFLGTAKSGLFADHSGLIRINPAFGSEPAPFIGFPTNIFTTQIWDIAFSPRGDLYISTSTIFDEVLIAETNGDVSFFAPLPSYDGLFSAAEITCNPDGLIIGCNNKGPFLVDCRQSIRRYEEATYSGGINNDAVAVDPVTDDIYFIHQNQRTLLRLPIDTLTAMGPVEPVANLSADEAEGARGMVCDSDRMIYILIDTEDVKKILAVSGINGTKTNVVDFFTRGSGSLQDAGVQRDLAIDTIGRILYTVDTLNNILLTYSLPGGPLGGNIEGSAISTSTNGSERLGLAVMD
jgi:sugar lactone lactonase YvrE